MLFPENLVVFNVFYVNIKDGIFQDSGNPHNMLANHSRAIKLILAGFLILNSLEKDNFSWFIHRKNLLLHNNRGEL